MTAFPLKELTPSYSETDNITYEDVNVVRYIAGYVCRKVRTKIEQSSRTNKAALINSLEGLLSDEEEDSATVSVDWVDVVDRGGLLHVKEGTYMLFCAMEEEVREHFRMDKETTMVEGKREQVENAVMDNDNVLFQWCMLATDISDTDAAFDWSFWLVYGLLFAAFHLPVHGWNCINKVKKEAYNGQKLSEKIFNRQL